MREVRIVCRRALRRFVHIAAFSLLAAACPISLCGQAGTAVQKQIARVIDAFSHNNFKELFDASYYSQARIQEIQRTRPQIMWQQLIETEFNEEQQSFSTARFASDTDTFSHLDCPGVMSGCGTFSKSPMDNLPFIPLGNLSDAYLHYVAHSLSSFKVLETRPIKWHSTEMGELLSGTLVYVQLSYDPAQPSPSRGEGELQKVIVAVVLQGTKNLYYSSEPVADSAVNAPDPPLRIMSIQWGAINDQRSPVMWDVQLEYSILGRGPYRSTSTCGDTSLEKIAYEITTPDNASIRGAPNTSQPSQLNMLFPGPQDKPFPMHCVVKVANSSAEDTVEFEVPAPQPADGRSFCWVNEPWFNWNQGGPSDLALCHHMPMKDVGLPKDQLPLPVTDSKRAAPGAGALPNTPSKSNGGGPTLAATTQFIQEKLNEQGQFGWAQTLSNNPEWTYRALFNLADVTADPAACTLYATEIEDYTTDPPPGKALKPGLNVDNLHTHMVVTDTIFFKKVEKITVEKMEDISNQANAEAGFPDVKTTITPPVFYVKLWASSAVFTIHTSTTTGKQAPVEKDQTSKTDGIITRDEETANKVAKAMTHAMELCGGGITKEELF